MRVIVGSSVNCGTERSRPAPDRQVRSRSGPQGGGVLDEYRAAGRGRRCPPPRIRARKIPAIAVGRSGLDTASNAGNVSMQKDRPEGRGTSGFGQRAVPTGATINHRPRTCRRRTRLSRIIRDIRREDRDSTVLEHRFGPLLDLALRGDQGHIRVSHQSIANSRADAELFIDKYYFFHGALPPRPVTRFRIWAAWFERA